MLETIIALIAKNGIGIVCLAVVLYDHLNFQAKMVAILDKICNRLTKIEDQLEIKEEEEDTKK